MGLRDLVHDIAGCLLQPVPEVHQVINNFYNESKIGTNTKLVGVRIQKLKIKCDNIS
jgi:hypothetical protein